MTRNSITLTVLVITAMLLAGIAACGRPPAIPSSPAPATGSPAPAEAQPLTIVTSFYPMYTMTRNIAKDVPGVRIVNLTEPTTGCLHDYQLTPANLETLAKASIFVVNGGGMEAFLDKVVAQQPQLKIVEAARGMELIKGPEGGNPHVWVSISGAMAQVASIAKQLAEFDSPHAAAYLANAAAYSARLEELRKEMHQAIDPLPNRRIVTFHEAFPYFAREFNLDIVAVIEREPGSEPSAAELAATIRQVKASGVKALFAEPQYPAKAAEAIARETNARVYTLDPAVTGPDSPDAYLIIMRQNLDVLRQALAS